MWKISYKQYFLPYHCFQLVVLCLLVAACGQAISFPTKCQSSVSSQAWTYFLLHFIALCSGTVPKSFFGGATKERNAITVCLAINFQSTYGFWPKKDFQGPSIAGARSTSFSTLMQKWGKTCKQKQAGQTQLQERHSHLWIYNICHCTIPFFRRRQW